MPTAMGLFLSVAMGIGADYFHGLLCTRQITQRSAYKHSLVLVDQP
jgi:hypothetical protein